MNLYSKLAKIQNELKAPKSQYNNFGKYAYRNCEDICEAVKPLLLANDLFMCISDELVMIGERYYIKATVTVTDGEASHTVTAYARESLDKKGMDDSQITGATSSYARKYALNGMYLIDDTKDADSMDNSKPQANDEKPWYNDFESHKAAMLEGIKSGEKTVDSIIKNLQTKYKVSKKVQDEIKQLGEK